MRSQNSVGDDPEPIRRFPGSRSTLGSWVKVICRAFDAAGGDSAARLAEVGVDIRLLDSPTMRCPLTLSFYMWECALNLTGDPAFGVKAASYIKNTSFHALSYGISASATLKEAFERSQRYCRLVSDAVDYEFSRRGDEYRFVIEPTTTVPNESMDCLVAAYLRMCRSLVGRTYSPRRIHLRRPRPSIVDDFHGILRAPLQFDAPRTLLVFDAQSIERSLGDGNPELALHNDAIALQHLSQIERQNIQARVRDVLRHRLSLGEPSQEDIAESLGMSVRTLQRKLGDSGTTYLEILDETRYEMARAHLSSRRYSINDVTHLLGFSAESCFTRAFRRWTGQSPSEWRARGLASPRTAETQSSSGGTRV
jgi:AraC-like DNA-binding protein